MNNPTRKLFFIRQRSVNLLGLVVFVTSVQGQAAPIVPEPGAVVIAWHSIARQARTYALVQLPYGVNQDQATSIANRSRFRGAWGYLANFSNAGPTEWQDVRSRFGAALGGRPVENIWVGARREADGFVRWTLGRTHISNVRAWNAWAPREPQHKTAVTLHALYPGLFNSANHHERYTRLLIEFR